MRGYLKLSILPTGSLDFWNINHSINTNKLICVEIKINLSLSVFPRIQETHQYTAGTSIGLYQTSLKQHTNSLSSVNRLRHTHAHDQTVSKKVIKNLR